MITGRGSAALLDKVPAAARTEPATSSPGCRWLRRANRTAEAVKLMMTAPRLDETHDLDQWWIERRLLVRRLIEDGNAKGAYALANAGTLPARSNYQVEHHFMAGWIALRFLKDAKTAYAHFSRIPPGQNNPIALGRGYYWRAAPWRRWAGTRRRAIITNRAHCIRPPIMARSPAPRPAMAGLRSPLRRR